MFAINLTNKVEHMIIVVYILPSLSWGYQRFLNHINRTELFSVINIVLYMDAYSSCFWFISKFSWTELFLLPTRKYGSKFFECQHWNSLTPILLLSFCYGPGSLTVVHRSDHFLCGNNIQVVWPSCTVLIIYPCRNKI